MKKFLLTMAVGLLGLGAANAEEVTFLASDYGPSITSGQTFSVKMGDFDFAFAKNGGSTNPTYNANGSDFRVYAKGSITITASSGITIEEVVYNISNQGLKRLAPITVNTGEIQTQTKGDKTVTWTGNSSNVSFTVGEKADFGTENTKAGQLCFSSVKIVYKNQGKPGLNDPELSFEQSSYTAKLGSAFESPVLNNPNNLSVTYSSSDEAVATVAADGKVTLVGAGVTTIKAASEETDKFNAGEAFYTLTVVKTYSSIEDFYTVGVNNKGIIDFPMTVTYVNGTSCYAMDDNGGYTLIYGSTSYKAGDVIPAGWEGQYSPFNGIPEIKPVGDMPASTENVGFTPEEVTSVSLSNMNQVLVLKGVTFAEATVSGATKTNFVGYVGDKEYAFRNNFADVPSVEPGKYDVTVAVAAYERNATAVPTDESKMQLYVIAYKEVAELADAPKITVDGQEFGDGNTINGEDEVTVVFPEVAEGQSIWYKTSTKTETRAAEEGFSKLEGNELKLDNTIDSLSYYVGDSEGTPVTKIATVKVDIFTAVEGIEAETGVATYYDLNGRVVKGQLEKGIYVKVVNGKASKVIVK